MSEAAKEQVVRERGTVKFFNASKGWGIICFPGNTEGVFVHFSQIQMEGYKTLQPQEEVTFQIEETHKGPQDINVRSRL